MMQVALVAKNTFDASANETQRHYCCLKQKIP
jgi:hypothetical protein